MKYLLFAIFLVLLDMHIVANGFSALKTLITVLLASTFAFRGLWGKERK